MSSRGLIAVCLLCAASCAATETSPPPADPGAVPEATEPPAPAPDEPAAPAPTPAEEAGDDEALEVWPGEPVAPSAAETGAPQTEGAGPPAAAPAANDAGDAPAVQEATPEGAQEAPDLAAAEPEVAPLAGETPPVVADTRSALSGYVALRYRGRFTDDEHDHDAYGEVSLDYEDPERPWISGHVLGQLEADLDGSDSDDSIFDSLADTYDSSLVARLYHAYVEVDREDWPASFRAGRMIDYETPEILHLDGVSLTSRPLGKDELEIDVYGGIPVHLYESSSEGDAVFGTALEARPWKGGRARLDWMHLEDEQLLGEERDDLLGLGVWQGFAERWLLEGQYSRLEGDDRDLRLRGQYADEDGDTVARVTYYELLETQKTQALEVDPFSAALLEYFPFRQAGVIVSQVLSERATVDLGVDMRRVTDEDDLGEFNRDWERYYATASIDDLFRPGLSFSLTGDRWDDDDRDIDTWGADLTLEPDETWEASIGSYYALYKYDLFNESERDDVRTYYARGTYHVSSALSMDLSYEFEDDDFEQYHTLRWGGQWHF